MKLFIIGATGRTGQELVNQALEQGYKVTAYVRNPEFNSSNSKLEVVYGQLDEVNNLAKAMAGNDVVLATLGNPASDRNGKLFEFAIPCIITAMDMAGVKRFISLSALGVGNTYENTRYPYRMGSRTFLKGNFADHLAGEQKLKSSDLCWTTVHPGPLFNGDRTVNPTVRLAKSGFKMSGTPRTNRSDVASVMLRIINDTSTFRNEIIMSSNQDQ